MARKGRRSTGKSKKIGTLRSTRVKCGATTEHTGIETYAKPKRLRPKKRIHRRRVIPAVRRGAAAPDDSPTTAMSLRRPSRMAATARARRSLQRANDLVLVQNVNLGAVADNNAASDVCEPSAACRDDVVFYTGNWFAAISTNGGSTFRFVDPNVAFPDPPGMSFCCDQVVHYIRRIDTFVWLLQYTENTAGANVQRLAFARTAAAKRGRWRTVDVTPQALGLGNQFLDFPDLAVGWNALYMTTNVFRGSRWTTSVILRLPFSGIRSGNVVVQRATSTTNFNFRVAQHCGRRVFWASHQDNSTLRVYHWDENAANPRFRDVTVPSWDQQNYRSRTPAGRNWLGRADPRILGATKAGRNLYFAWSAGRGGANNRPHPYVQVAKIDSRTFRLKESINLWDRNFATAYPALGTNSRRQVGISLMLGGGQHHPSFVVGTLTGLDRFVLARRGTRSPAGDEWGDYLTLRRRYPNPRLFCGTGYTRQSGAGSNDATPTYVVFGRSSHV